MEEGLSEEDIGTAMEVGGASRRALEHAKEMIKPGIRLIDVANAVESSLLEQGFGAAFPINLSVNSEAAHYTPCLGDERVFGEDDIIKVDFGAERSGFMGDCAVTVDLSGERYRLVEAVDDALSNAISTVRAGARVGDIGREISKAITSKGYKPIRNLGGHGVGRGDLHTGLFIPNHDDGSEEVLKEGTIIAIEPFATDGLGMVTDGDTCEIFSYASDSMVRSQSARRVLNGIKERYPSAPFAVRWLSDLADSKFALYAAVQELVRSGSLEPHPTLIEVKGGMVAQAEAELLVESDGCSVLTK